MAGSGSFNLQRHFQFEPVGLSAFYGGMSIDKKLATKSPQFYYGRHIDFRKNPSQFTVLPQGGNAAVGVVSDLVLDMAQIDNGVKYAVGDTGKVYVISNTGIWSNYGLLNENSGAGIVYRSDVDHTYISGQSSISRIKRTANAPAYQQKWFANGISTCATCSAFGGQKLYTTPTVILEDVLDARTFTSDIEPLYKIGVGIVSAGTGNLTLTLHNDANDLLASVTILAANVLANSVNYFVFSSPIRIQRGDLGKGSALTYHYHITSTTGDTTIATPTLNSVAGSDMELWANALVTPRNGLHPIINFTNYTLFANGNYVAQYEPLQDNPQMNIDYLPHRITLPPGYEVCGFAQKNLLCVIGAEKRSPTGEFQDGALFFWDGTSETYDDFWPVPQGAPESLYANDNTVYFNAGGALYQIQSTDQPIRMRSYRGTDSEFSGITDSTHCYPHMMTVRRGILLMAYPSVTTLTNLEHAVYSYGQNASAYPVSYGLSYSPSTGTSLNNGSNNLRIGMIKNFGDTLFTSWQDSSNFAKFGVDVTNNFSPVATTATLESIVFDGSRILSPKRSSYIIAIFDPLPIGTIIILKYKLDSDTNWTYSNGSDVTNIPLPGSTFFVFNIPFARERFYQLQYGIDLQVTGNSPAIQAIYTMVDLQILEKPLGAGI
jgi:hypothetical protein